MEPIPDAVRDFVRAARVCRIATVLPAGEPHLIPVCPVFDGGATVYIDIGRKYASAQGVRDSGKMAVLIDYYDDNWALLKGVLLRCTAEAIEGEERDRAWDLIREKFPAVLERRLGAAPNAGPARLRLAPVGHHGGA